MPALVTDNFRVKTAEDFIAEVSNNELYLGIGRILPWTDDNNPPAPIDSITDLNTFWDRMIAAKSIAVNDVSHVVTRIDWTTGTVYDEYDPTSATYYDGDFYVLTDDFNVYKCITNNGGAQSTTKPTSTSAAIFQTADGYEWKYMYTITTGEALKFLTPQHMPVKNIGSNVDIDGPGATPYPYGGHGYDNIYELNANLVALTVSLEFDESGNFAVDNDYRAIAIIADPFLFETTTPATNATYRQTTLINVINASGQFNPDEEVSNGVNTADVVEYDDANGELYVIVTNGSFTSGTLTGGTSGATADIDTVVDPELDPYSGNVLYVEHREPISRASDQTETLTTILEF